MERDKQLPVLRAIVDAIPQKEVLDLQSVAFVCVQHILLTTINLLESLVQLGANPSHIHIMGKLYSSCPWVAEALISRGYNYYFNSEQNKVGTFEESFRQDVCDMWKKVEDSLHPTTKSILILDDGGFCLTNVPDSISKKYSLVGIEQTSSGVSNLRLRKLSFPIVEVATSAAKQLVEPPMIADAVIKKLEKIIPTRKKGLVCGIVGVGSIGTAITHKLLSLNHKVRIYDKDPEKVKDFNKAISDDDIEVLFKESDYIFGCSGEDITKNLDISVVNKEKVFVSCSSQDNEFLTLLKLLQENGCAYHSVLEDLSCTINNHRIRVIRGGFPVNLDNSGESVPASDIQLTRGLLLGGVLQGILCLLYDSNQEKTQYMVHPVLQSFIISQWRLYGSAALFSEDFLDLFYDLEWVQQHSRGVYEKNNFLEEHFYKLIRCGHTHLPQRYIA